MHPPHACPACRERLRITALSCTGCGTRVEGHFDVCPLCQLPPEDRVTLESFLRSRGNVRELQRELGVSYPTARSRVEQIWERLGYRRADAGPESASVILGLLRNGEIDVTEAEVRLRRRRGAREGTS